jgi:hypothetical protein
MIAVLKKNSNQFFLGVKGDGFDAEVKMAVSAFSGRKVSRTGILCHQRVGRNENVF